MSETSKFLSQERKDILIQRLQQEREQRKQEIENRSQLSHQEQEQQISFSKERSTPSKQDMRNEKYEEYLQNSLKKQQLQQVQRQVSGESQKLNTSNNYNNNNESIEDWNNIVNQSNNNSNMKGQEEDQYQQTRRKSSQQQQGSDQIKNINNNINGSNLNFSMQPHVQATLEKIKQKLSNSIEQNMKMKTKVFTEQQQQQQQKQNQQQIKQAPSQQQSGDQQSALQKFKNLQSQQQQQQQKQQLQPDQKQQNNQQSYQTYQQSAQLQQFRAKQQQQPEQQYLSVQRLMFGDSPPKYAVPQKRKNFRSRSNDEPSDSFLQIGGSQRCIKRGCATSQSPYREKQMRSGNNLDFEFFNTSADEAAALVNLVSKHGKKQIGENNNNRITEYQRRTEEEYINQKNFPFKPKINELPREIYTWNEKPKLEISKEEQWSRLLKGKNEIQDDREILKIQKDANYLSQNCTFQPKINEISALLTKRDKYQKTVVDRLYEKGVEKVKGSSSEQFSLRQQQEIKFLQNHPFKPDVGTSVSKLTGNEALKRPLCERVDEVVKEKQEKQIQLQLQYNEESKHPFKPELNDISQKINEKRMNAESRDVIERMMVDAMRKVHEKQMNEINQENMLSEQCTFYPSVVASKNQEILENNEFFKASQSFLDRQYKMADYVKEKLEKKIDEYAKNNTHRPSVNKISQYLVETDEARANETQQDKIVRLALKDREKKEILQEQMQKAYYEKFTFKPKLNHISKAMAEKPSIDDLVDTASRNEKIVTKRAEIEKEQMKECTFKPKTNQNKQFNHLSSRYSTKENISTNVQDTQMQREKKREQMKQMVEYEEMKECTFKPILNNDIYLQQQLSKEQDCGEQVQIRGMDKYMQYRELFKKQKMEQKERETKKGFGLYSNYDNVPEGLGAEYFISQQQQQQQQLPDQGKQYQQPQDMEDDYSLPMQHQKQQQQMLYQDQLSNMPIKQQQNNFASNSNNQDYIHYSIDKPKNLDQQLQQRQQQNYCDSDQDEFISPEETNLQYLK